MKRASVRLGLVISGKTTLPYLIRAAPTIDPAANFHK